MACDEAFGNFHIQSFIAEIDLPCGTAETIAQTNNDAGMGILCLSLTGLFLLGAGGEELLEEITKVGILRILLLRPEIMLLVPIRWWAELLALLWAGAQLIIGFALFLIAENLIGFVDFFKAGFGGFIFV